MKPASPLLVGSFVLGSVSLLLIALLALHGMRLFAPHLRIVAVFSDSVAGLDAGAPVTFRGVRIGRVEGMHLHADLIHHRSWIPVYLDLDLDRISWGDASDSGRVADLRAAIADGLRAQLVSQGLVSDQLSVNLDYFPNSRAAPTGHAENGLEIPTISSDIQNLKDELRGLDLADIARHSEVVLTAMEQVLRELDSNIAPVAGSLRQTLTATSEAVRGLQENSAQTLADIDRLANESRLQIAANGNDLDALLRAATQTTKRADDLMATLNDVSSPQGDLQASLRDLAASLGSLRGVTHDFERDPVGTLLRKEKE